MIFACDWQHAIEDGGIGGVIIAVIWGIWTWLKSRSPRGAK